MISRQELVGVLDVLQDLSPTPPCRIMDFRAIVNPAAMQITLLWTAPGNQLDHGKGNSI